MDPRFLQFINSKIKTKVDYDGYYGAQCVDLYREYCKVMYGITDLEMLGEGGARDIYLKYSEFPNERRYFVQLDAKKHSFAKSGDIAIWDKTETNPYGHVAIVVDDQVQDILVLEQDGFKQDGCKLALRSKDNLLGYLMRHEP